VTNVNGHKNDDKYIYREIKFTFTPYTQFFIFSMVIVPSKIIVFA
jgi:hypothetical protein